VHAENAPALSQDQIARIEATVTTDGTPAARGRFLVGRRCGRIRAHDCGGHDFLHRQNGLDKMV